MTMRQQVEDDARRVDAKSKEGAESLDRKSRLPTNHAFEQSDRLGPVGEAKHVSNLLGGDDGAGVDLHQGLVEQRLGVAHRAFRGPGDQGEGFAFDPRALGFGDSREIAGDDRGLDAAQIEPLAAREDGHRDLADLGGGEDELGVRRRLLEGLEQGVEGVRREHVHFVDDVDLVAGLGGGVADTVDQLAHLVDLGAAGGVEFEDIEVPALDDRPAVPALDGQMSKARLAHGVALVVERPGEQAGGGGLAYPANAREHESVGDAAAGKGVGQGPDHGFLAD